MEDKKEGRKEEDWRRGGEWEEGEKEKEKKEEDLEVTILSLCIGDINRLLVHLFLETFTPMWVSPPLPNPHRSAGPKCLTEEVHEPNLKF